MKYLTITEAAELLQLDRTTVWKWIDQGRIKGVRRKGIGSTSPILIPEKEIRRLVEEHDLILAEENE